MLQIYKRNNFYLLYVSVSNYYRATVKAKNYPTPFPNAAFHRSTLIYAAYFKIPTGNI